jgi:hypothetical protein
LYMGGSRGGAVGAAAPPFGLIYLKICIIKDLAVNDLREGS